MSEWREGLVISHSIGVIFAEEENGRRFFRARVVFPRPSNWWDRSTETCSVADARSWIDEQAADWEAHVSTKDVQP